MANNLIESVESFLATGGEPESPVWRKGNNGTWYGPIQIFYYDAQPPDDGHEWVRHTDSMGNSCWVRKLQS